MKKVLVAVLSTAAVFVLGPSVPGLVGDKIGDAISSLNPFDTKSVDRTGASVLQSLTDLSDYHAASAHYETVIDLEDDTDYVPDWLRGERVLYVAKGDVDAMVDFGELDERSVVVSEDRTSVSITLPEPTVGKPVLDVEGSYVADHDEGFTNAFSGSDMEHEAQVKAIDRMTETAAGEGMLLDKAQENTTAMLRGLLGALGYKDVTVTYDA